jgi:coenzyme F420 hydrogenase subunit delta
MLKSIYEKQRLVFGCGNPLFGDDGFGPEVIRLLESLYFPPRDTACLDVGTAIRDFLLDILLLEKKPAQMIIIDAMDLPRTAAGQISEIEVDDIHPAKIGDYSLHQFPTVNMLKEIRTHTAIDVRILVTQPADIPSEVRPGLSSAVKAAAINMCERIIAILETPLQNAVGRHPNLIVIRVGQLADRLGVHRNTVTNWIREGKIKARPTVGRKYAIEEAEFIKFCRQSGVAEHVVQEFI